jgi:uncharacterized LabA/DUF88 family protein
MTSKRLTEPRTSRNPAGREGALPGDSSPSGRDTLAARDIRHRWTSVKDSYTLDITFALRWGAVTRAPLGPVSFWGCFRTGSSRRVSRLGYLKAAAAHRLKAKITDLTPEPQGCVEWLRDLGSGLPGSSNFLRVYWYDGAYDSRHAKHEAQRRFFDRIAKTPAVQLRLGHIQVRTPKWQYPVKAALKKVGVDLAEFEKHFQFRSELGQKGVDTLIALDLVRLAQRHVFETAVLIAGDRDLAEPVRVAQDAGRRVIVAIPEGGGIATELAQLADEVRHLGEDELRRMFTLTDPGDAEADARG